MSKLENKEAVLFWLRRHLKSIEARCDPPSQDELARRGVSYERRADLMAQADKVREDSAGEMRSISSAIAFIEENG